MNAVIYARYSSDNQREESIDGQLRECMAFAESKGLTVLKSYIDRAISGKNADNRPEFQQMIKDSGKKMFEVILVWKLDRFARSRFDSAHYKHILKKNEIRLVSATENISHGSEGILLETLLEGMAEYYSVELAEKVVRGLTENALKCKYNGGTLPIGYAIDSEQHFQIDPVSAPVVLKVFHDYNEGATMQELVNILNEQGVRTFRGTKITLCLMLSLISPLTAYADTGGSGNVDGGGGGMGDGTSSNSWNLGDEGVRVTVVRASDQARVSIPFYFMNKAPSVSVYHFGKVSKLQYSGGQGLSPVQGGYVAIKPAQAMPRIISTNGSTNIAAIKKYFCSEYVVKRIAEVTGIKYDILIGGDYKILIEPIAY